MWAGAVVAAVGLLAFAGWVLEADALKSILPTLPTMKANTALGFFFAGLSLSLHKRRALRFACAGIVFAIAGLTFVQDLAGADFGLDQLLFRDQTDLHTLFPGRMAEATALAFLLGSVSLLMLGAQARAGLRAQQTLAVCVGMIGVVALLGYAYNAEQLYRLAGYSSMALHTAASFVVLAIGLIFARPDGLAGVLIAPGPATALARSMLPAALLLPAVLGWLVWWGLYQGYYGAGMDLALLVLALTLSFAALVLGTARTLEHSDAKRREAESAQRASEERLRFSLESCQIGAWDLDLQDHTAYRSLEHDRIFGYRELQPSWTLDDFLKHALPEYRAPVDAMVREATAKKTGWTYECQIRRADGEVRWIWFSGQHRTDASGRSRVAGVVQDITERKQTEEALRQSREDLERAQTVGQVGSWRLDTRRNILTWSDENHRIFGLPKGTPMSYETFLSTIHPDDRQYVDTQWQAGMRGAPYDIEHRIVVDGPGEMGAREGLPRVRRNGRAARRLRHHPGHHRAQARRGCDACERRAFLRDYPHGDGCDHRAGSGPADHPFQRSGGTDLPLFRRRSHRPNTRPIHTGTLIAEFTAPTSRISERQA